MKKSIEESAFHTTIEHMISVLQSLGDVLTLCESGTCLPFLEPSARCISKILHQRSPPRKAVTPCLEASCAFCAGMGRPRVR